MSNEVLDLDILAEVLFEQGLDALMSDLEGSPGDASQRTLAALRAREDVLRERPWELALQLMAELGQIPELAHELGAARPLSPLSLRHGFAEDAEPEPSRTYDAHHNFVGGLVFLPGGEAFVSSSEDGSVRRWSLTEDDCQEVLREGSPVNRLRLDLAKERLLMAGDDSNIEVWDLDPLRRSMTLSGHSGYVSKLEPLPDGRIISISADTSVRVWEQDTGACLANFGSNHNAWVFALAVSPDGSRAVTSSLNHTMIAWDLENLEVERVIIGEDNGDVHMIMGDIYMAAPNTSGRGHDDAPSVMRWSKDGERLISAAKDIVIWDAQDFSELSRLPGHAWKIHDMVLFDNDTKLVTVAHCIKVWDLETGEELRSFLGHGSDEIYSVTLSPDEKTLITGDTNGKIHVWELDAILAGSFETKHMGRVDSVAISPDGRTGLSAASDKSGILWDLETGKARHVLTGHKDLFVSAHGFIAGGREVVTSCSGEMFCWDVETGERSRTFVHHNSLYNFEGLTFFDEDRKAIAGDTIRSLYFFDLEDESARAEKLMGRTAFCNRFAWSKDERYLLTNCYFDKSDDYDWDDDGEQPKANPEDGRPYNNGVQRWDIENRVLDREYYPEVLRGNSDDTEYPSRVLLDEDRDLLVAGSSCGPLHFWSYERGEFLFELRVHNAYVLALGINAQGHIISVAQDDDRIHVSDPEARASVREIRCPFGTMREPVIFEEGRFLAACCGEDGNLLVLFDLEQEALLSTYTHPHRISALVAADGVGDESGTVLLVGDAHGQTFVLDVATRGSRDEWMFVASEDA